MQIRNIVIDKGNTLIKYGIFNDTEILELGEVKSSGDILKIVSDHVPDYIMYSSVSKKNKKLLTRLREETKVLKLNHKTPLPFINHYQTPKTLGPDRLAAVAGAFHMFRDQNTLVIDTGTCVTYDFIDAEGNYHGGAISPGLQMRSNALHYFTAKLPKVEMTPDAEVIGKTTAESINSGVGNGMLMEVQGMIRYYEETFKDLHVVICGGDSNFFETKLKGHIFAVANLVLIGLNRILLYNIENFEDFN